MSLVFENIPIIISFLISLSIYFNRDWAYYLRIFPIFLFLSILAQVVGYFLEHYQGSNITFYNFFSVFEFEFYLWTLRAIIQNLLYRKIILQLLWIYPLLFLMNIIFIQPITQFHSITYSIGALLIVILTIYYFFEIFQRAHSVKLLQESSIWICFGLLFFYSCSFPIFGLTNIIAKAHIINISIFRMTILVMNIVLYSSFSIAFLCRIRVRKSIS
jgi:hypothetical protein